jgi:uncharacterized membrane protein
MTRSQMKPLHPPLTDFPAALWITAFAFDIGSIWVGNAMVRAAYFNLVAGCIMAVFAALAGVFDYSRIRRGAPAKRIGLIHALLNVVALMVFIVGVVARTRMLSVAATPMPLVALSAVGVALVGVSSYLGGQLVYDLGVNVRMVTPTDRSELRRRTPVRS